MTDERRVVLRNTEDSGGRRLLEAFMRDGDLVVSGNDTGPAVEEFWGKDDYEWETTVRAEHIPALMVALGGVEGSDPMALIEAKCTMDDGFILESVLRDEVVPVERWSF